MNQDLIYLDQGAFVQELDTSVRSFEIAEESGVINPDYNEDDILMLD